jgi:hypothetical protein
MPAHRPARVPHDSATKRAEMATAPPMHAIDSDRSHTGSVLTSDQMVSSR